MSLPEKEKEKNYYKTKKRSSLSLKIVSHKYEKDFITSDLNFEVNKVKIKWPQRR